MTNSLSHEQECLLNSIRNKLNDVNTAIREAVDSGLSVELVRTHRHHQTGGYWGDIMAPAVVKGSAKT
jgi:hypothetical protein